MINTCPDLSLTGMALYEESRRQYAEARSENMALRGHNCDLMDTVSALEEVNLHVQEEDAAMRSAALRRDRLLGRAAVFLREYVTVCTRYGNADAHTACLPLEELLAEIAALEAPNAG